MSIAETSGSGFVGSSWDLGATYGFWASEALSIGPGLRARYTRAITAAEGDPMIDVWTGCASISMTYH